MSQEATIRRGVRNARYTTVPNHVFEDDRLSMEARWLLGYLLSKPDDWTVRLNDIRKKGGCGRDKARAMVAELVKAGYAEKEPSRKDGKFNGLCLVIYDEPRTETSVSTDSVASLPQPEKPSTVEPSTVLPSPVNPPLVSTEGLAIPESTVERERGRETDRRKIENAGWALLKDWPGFAGMPKEPALRMWCALPDEDRADAARMFPHWLALLKAQKKSHVPAPSTYFGQRLWADVPEPQAVKPTSVEAKPFGPLWMAARLKYLLAGPTMRVGDLTSFERSMVAEGRATEAELLLAKQSKAGFPAVNFMHEQAANRRGISVSPALEAIVTMMVAVPVGCETYLEWRSLHERMGWPGLPDPGGQPVVYFPAGGPEGLGAFEAAIRGNGNDGDRREAAE